MTLNEIINGRENDLAILDQNRRLTYADFRAAIDNCRNSLYADGIRKGDRVAIFSKNSAEFIITYFAIASLGAIVVPLNFQLSAREIAFIVDDAGIDHIYTWQPLALDEYNDRVLQHDINLNGRNDGSPAAPSVEIDENDPCALVYTSGTTGSPKGATLSHKNLTSNARQMRVMGCTDKCKVLCILPIYHCFGWTCAVLYSFINGASIAIIRDVAPKSTIDLIREERITDIYAVPPIYRLITMFAEKDDLKTIRLALNGGTTLPDKIANDFTEKFGIKIVGGYGLSESSPVVSMSPPELQRKSSVGRVVPETEVRFVIDGKDVPRGEVGELLVRGDQVMLGYWNQPEITRQVLDEDGWLHTGDLARIDEDGYVYIVDRLKEMIISMGENIYPREVEEIVYRFDNIKEAAVIGIEDKIRGQACSCYFSSKDGAKIDTRALKKFLQKNLALYKVPREYHQLEELPHTSTGKIFKRALIEQK